MQKTFLQFYRELQEDGHFARLALDPNAQFGSEDQPMLGASILPEQFVTENAYEETQVRYRTQPALDGARYSPAQMQKSGHLVGSVKVELGNTDTADQLTGADHDGLVKLLMRGGDEQAIAQALMWTDKSLIRPHTIKNEIQRWQAIILGDVKRRGSDGYQEDVSFYAPNGHRPVVSSGTIAAPQGWYNDSYDPLADIALGVETLEDLGYSVAGMFSSGKLTSVLKRNGEVAKRNSRVVINAGGTIASTSARITDAQLRAILEEEEFPAITKYNGGYESPNGFKRFIDVAPNADRDYFVIVGRTERQWDMATSYAGAVDADLGDFADGAIVLGSTLGYYAVGRNVGQAAPGRTVFTEPQERKPAGMYGESYQTGFPVITEPQAIYVIQVMRPTAS
jgi:hypothetical protein